MKHSLTKIQKGIGLIEVLIATIVIAVGLLSVASLQGSFVSSSGVSKTHSEALVLAEKKLEMLRNNVTATEYNALAAGAFTDAGNPIAGTNASFTRSWTITGADAPNRKRVSMQVGWDSNGDGDVTDADEIVNVVTEMAWIDPAKSTQYVSTNAIGGSSSVASPRQNASEDVASINVIGGTALSIPSGVTAGTATSISVIIPPTTSYPNGGSGTLVQVAPGSHFYTLTNNTFVTPGVIAVFLCTTTCTHIQNHFGGVVHQITGTVYSTSSNGFTNIKVAWTSSSVNDCYNGTVSTDSGSGSNHYRYRPYECIYAGNCNATADGENGCFADTIVSDAQINTRNVGPGGEYGDVGLLGVDDQGGNREQVCLLEDTVDPATSPLLDVSGSEVLNENYLYSVTKRFYSGRRIKHNASINDQKSEGINRSYTNHNFLVVSRGTGASANQTCNLNAVAKSISLAPREIFKILDEGLPNTSLAETAYAGAAGTAKTFTWTLLANVANSATKLKLIIPDEGNCYLNNNTSTAAATAYVCAVPPGTTSVAIKGGSNEYPTLNPAVWASCTKTDTAPCIWPTNFTASATPSNNCTAPWGDTVPNTEWVPAYQNAVEPNGSVAVSPYTCPNAQTLTCSGTPGVLSSDTGFANFTNKTCHIAASPNCTAQLNGASIPIYHDSISPIEAYTVASAPAGLCPAARSDLSCTNGILSGSGTFYPCLEQTTRTITVTATQSGTGTVSDITVTGTGATCVGTTCTVDNAWTGTLIATGTCSGGGSISGTSSSIVASATTATITLASCTGPVCTTPWSTTVASGGSVPAYSASSVLSPSTCASVQATRYCNNGVLSDPTFTHQSCSVIPTYSITVTAANGSGSVSSNTCNGSSCSGLVAGTYNVAVALSGGDTCSGNYTINANKSITVTKATGQGQLCTMSP
jgi:type IV pilus modification protein PilV